MLLDSSVVENITRCKKQPEILYIEMDEIHTNLQHGGNKIYPCAIAHEGYKEDFVKRKQLKNIRFFASPKLSYEELLEVVFDYVNKKYDMIVDFKELVRCQINLPTFDALEANNRLKELTNLRQELYVI